MHIYQDAPRPFHGLARVAFHLDEAVALSWYAFFLAVCLAVFVGRGARGALVGWLLACLLFLDYPRVTGALLVDAYLVAAIGTGIAAW